ncbi:MULTISPECIES: glycosyltransferase family 8 protein [Clostridium]|uniref:glycosyltransferase family 8 protein n=1 Tax=Clostridium TaxID=1485 RepID=UPI002586B710|nr:glycosyltransferase family 8 protein [Clostridium sp.]MCI6139233.1 glycosyltransferase family 8 protein [Clostridium sp.]
MEWNTETANIIYASNDGYAGHLAASLCSLLDNNGNIPLMDIYVLSVGMSRDYQERLACVAEKYNRRLYVLELGDLKERFDFDIDTRGFDISAMARLFAPEALPAGVKRALYLDCDTIVWGSVRSLYETELENNLAGMVMEPTVYKEMKDSIGMGPDDPYYNSGVLLMDLEGWRREDVLRQLLNFYKSCRGRLFACDQDTINGTLRGRILSLPVKYNYFTNYRYFRYSTLVSLCAAYGDGGEKDYRMAGRAPVIIHFLGDERPWIKGNHNHFRRLYEYYLDKTPWRGTPAQPGKELYMQLWWLFNQLSWLFPSFRLWVSRRMGMKLIDSRKKALAAGQGEGNH